MQKLPDWFYAVGMTIKLNHTIVHGRDKRESAEFFAGIFGLPAPVPFGPFLDVEVGNEVTLAFLGTDEEIQVLLEIITRPYGSGAGSGS